MEMGNPSPEATSAAPKSAAQILGTDRPLNVPLEPPPPPPKVVVWVGERTIDEAALRAEVQYHPAPSLAAALHEATRALVVRELLLQAAVAEGLLSPGARGDERTEQAAIDELTARNVPVPAPDEAAERRYYDEHAERFVGHALYDASHILLAAPSAAAAATDAEAAHARNESRAKAAEILAALLASPERFERMAREHSLCPSAKQGGRLGQLSKGETVPAFEAALADLAPQSICPTLVETEHGFHIVQLNARAERLQLPFSAVRDRIRVYLRDRAWRRAVREYVDALARQIGVRGFDVAARTPASPAGPAQNAVVSKEPRRLRVLA